MKSFVVVIGLFLALPLVSKGQSHGVGIKYSPLKKIIPNENLPKEVKCRNANNNIDIVRFEGRYYVSFRTAPMHFASKKTKIHVLSTTDFESWRQELEIEHGRDKRECRFLVLHDKLFLYFFDASKCIFKFDPNKVWVCERKEDGSWDKHIITGLDGYVPWRVKSCGDHAYMSVYYGKDLYKSGHKGDLRLLVSHDGMNWEPISDLPQITTSGAEEGEFEFDNEGNLWGTIRLESTGSYIAYADKSDLKNWMLTKLDDKYDSAFMFAHNNEMYVIARRNLDGAFDKFKKMPWKFRQKFNLISYWFSGKVTALYKLNKNEMKLEHLFDFPSTGDTAFPALAKIDNNSYYFLNYSSDIERHQKVWFAGQLGKTFIYQTKLTFPPF